jgi:hypothetical protein
MIKGWVDGEEDTICPWGGPQGNATAKPCGHRLEEIWRIWLDMNHRRLAWTP